MISVSIRRFTRRDVGKQDRKFSIFEIFKSNNVVFLIEEVQSHLPEVFDFSSAGARTGICPDPDWTRLWFKSRYERA